jgi:ribonuclease-3
MHPSDDDPFDDGEEARDAAALAELAELLGHRFGDVSLLAQALTHRSANEGSDEEETSYERLEFLGDAVLGVLAAEWLFGHLASDEGELSKIKSYVVSEPVLARCAAELGLGALLRLGVGEERSGGRAKPSLLADALEAVIGALYVDGGLEVARRFTAPLLRAGVESFRAGAQWRDPKTALQERLQADGGEPPVYRLVATSGPDHQKRFAVECWAEGTLLGAGEGSSKKRAEQAAAAAALARIGT